ncbi:MAG TPA: hypothetical protein VMV01_01520, partial [Planctomycetota bacterium]|nr:hypothetical protein [Planctomycetota bacterium]
MIEGPILGGSRIVFASTGTQCLRSTQPAPGRLGAHLPLGACGLEPAQGHAIACGLQSRHVTSVRRM